MLDSLGIPILSNKNFIDILYQNKTDFIESCYFQNTIDVSLFNEHCNSMDLNPLKLYNNLDFGTFDKDNQENYFMPKKYLELNIEDYLHKKCKNTEELNRVDEELKRFSELGMLKLLNYLVYLVDKLKEEKILWGVGRGSSVASYVLFLIGVHKINSLKYNLDYREFLR